jgi:hypothetical protein
MVAWRDADQAGQRAEAEDVLRCFPVHNDRAAKIDEAFVLLLQLIPEFTDEAAHLGRVVGTPTPAMAASLVPGAVLAGVARLGLPGAPLVPRITGTPHATGPASA